MQNIYVRQLYKFILKYKIGVVSSKVRRDLLELASNSINPKEKENEDQN